MSDIIAELVDNIAEVDIEFPYKGDKGDTGTTDWNGLSNKPDTFPPSTHTHDERYYTETETDAFLNGKSDTTHNHDERYYTETETASLLLGKSDTSHNHDERYYTKTEADQHAADTDIHVTATQKEQWTAKQDELVSGTNIKTVNNQSIVGAGNIAIEEADLPLEMHDGVLCWIVEEE